MTLFSRRELLQLASVVGFSASGWMRSLAMDTAKNPQRKRSCILLWMSGGPSQMDTFDLKPGHANGGPIKEIQTAAPGVRISEHLPKLATHFKDLSIVRGMSTKEGDHSRATFLLRTGNLPQGAIEFPSLGSLVAKELTPEKPDLPSFISIAPQRFGSMAAFSSGYLGPQFAPLVVADGQSGGTGQNVDSLLKVQDLDLPKYVQTKQADDRMSLLQDLESAFLTERPGVTTSSHKAAYEQAVRLMKSEATRAFDLSQESAKLRDQYGRSLFGQGCLLARRLVERNVPFVEVTFSGNGGLGWDTHSDNFNAVKQLSEVLDPAWATLMADLKDHGLLETTTVIWMGEFGRTPKINPQRGRDHYPNAWSAVLGGGGIKGGQVYGATSKDGTTVEKDASSVPDLLATICHAIGIDPAKTNMSNVGRPIRIVDKLGNPIKELVG